MNFKHLLTFVTICECGTVSRAAAQLHITQPALSRRIEALQKEMEKIKGRLLVRPSGTEPVIRVMTEAPDEKVARKLATKAIDLFRGYSSTGQVTEI